MQSHVPLPLHSSTGSLVGQDEPSDTSETPSPAVKSAIASPVAARRGRREER